MAALGRAVPVERVGPAHAVQVVAADRRVAAGEEPLADGHVAHAHRGRQAVVADDRVAVLVLQLDVPREPGAQPEADASRHDDAAGRRQLAVDEPLEEGLREADLRPELPQRQFAVQGDEGAPSGIEDVVARVAHGRRRDRGDAHLREEPVDQRTVGGRDPVVEDAVLLQRVLAQDAPRGTETPGQVHAGGPVLEAEARASPLLGARDDLEVSRAPESRLPVGRGHAVLGCGLPPLFRPGGGGCRRVVRRAAPPQADPAEQVDGPVAAEEVPPADLDEPSRGDLRRLDFLELHAHAVSEAGGWRLLDGDDDVPHVLVALRDLGDGDPAEEPQRRQPPLALADGVERQRLTRLHDEFPADCPEAHAVVAGDEHVADEDARALAHAEAHGGVRRVGAALDGGIHAREPVTEVQVLDEDPVAVGVDVGLIQRPAGLRRQAGQEPFPGDGVVAGDLDRGDDGARAFGDSHRDEHRRLAGGPGVRHGLARGFAGGLAEPALPVGGGQRREVRVHDGLDIGLSGRQAQERRQLLEGHERRALDGHAGHTVQRPLRHREHDPLAVGPDDPLEVRPRVPIPAAPQVRHDAGPRVLQEVLVHGGLSFHGDEFVHLPFRERIAREFDRDRPAPVDRDRHEDLAAALGFLDERVGCRLEVVPRPPVLRRRVELPAQRDPVEDGPRPDVQPEPELAHRVPVLGTERHRPHHRSGSARDVEHEAAEAGIARRRAARRDGRAEVPLVFQQFLDDPRDVVGPPAVGLPAEPLGDRRAQRGLGHAELAPEHDRPGIRKGHEIHGHPGAIAVGVGRHARVQVAAQAHRPHDGGPDVLHPERFPCADGHQALHLRIADGHAAGHDADVGDGAAEQPGRGVLGGRRRRRPHRQHSGQHARPAQWTHWNTWRTRASSA